jgi:translocation and assembly module TamB
LDLAIVKTNDNPPLISGALRLRQSFYLQSINRLVPGRLAKPAERPPYFSIDNPALADWRLNITVTGQRFMRVQDPLFNGEVSANLKLTGTLKDPIALGDVKIDSGLVQFPFGNLQVTTGFITLTSENPYNPQLQVIAASRQFGYDVRMEITGPANRPVIQFTSLPMLTSQQILLMLTTGQSPRSDFTLSPQQRVQSLAIYLGKSLLTKYGFTGGADRLTFRSGEEISTQGRPTYDVEYKLTKRWSVVGEYDRFGNFNGGFKWLLYSR